jgi:hypothetical protein
MGRTRTGAAAAITLDTGALIALDRGDKRMIALLQRALAQGRVFRVPAGVVGQAWRDGRVQVMYCSGPAGQHSGYKWNPLNHAAKFSSIEKSRLA